MMQRLACLAVIGATLGPAAAADPADPASGVIASIDLADAFHTRSDWHLTISQAPPIADPFGSGDDQVPGAVTLCLHKAASDPCDTRLQNRLYDSSENTLFAERHYLNRATVVRPRGKSGPPILLVATASLHSGDGDQAVMTQALRYQPGPDRFVRAYEHWTGTNNNQEVRYIEAGPLAGDIVAVDQAESVPFAYWVVVNAPAPDGLYHQVLRYRSATGYADGNALPVIDSEMANIQRRLGLWRAGMPLPLPATGCPNPHLIHMELWCG